MQGMAELVEQRARIVEREERRLARRRLGEIPDVQNDRTHVAGQLLLVAEPGHPGAAPLGGAREIVADEEADRLAALPGDRPETGVRMIERNAADFLKGEGEKARSRVEPRRDDVLELQVRLDLGAVEIEAPLP